MTYNRVNGMDFEYEDTPENRKKIIENNRKLIQDNLSKCSSFVFIGILDEEHKSSDADAVSLLALVAEDVEVLGDYLDEVREQMKGESEENED
jgi:hypothetical protein